MVSQHGKNLQATEVRQTYEALRHASLRRLWGAFQGQDLLKLPHALATCTLVDDSFHV